MKFLAFLLFIALVGSNAYWFAEKIDQGATDAYNAQGNFEVQSSLQQSKKLLTYFSKGLTKTELKRVLEGEGHQCYEKEGALHGEWISFEYDAKGVIVGVQ